MSFDQRVVEGLVRTGKVTPDQIDRAVETANDRGLRLSDALLHLQMTTQQDVAKATADELGLQWLETVDIDEVDVDLSMD